MAQAHGLADLSAHGDSLEEKLTLESCLSPLMDEVFAQPDSVEDMLGRAPRQSIRSSQRSLKDHSPDHCTRLFEVVPAANRLSPRRSSSFSFERRILNLEQGVSEIRPPALRDKNISSAISPLPRTTKQLSPERRNSFSNMNSSSADRASQQSKYPSTELSWVIPLRLFSSKKTKNIGLETSRLPKGIRAYYERQDVLINAYEAMATESKLNVLCENVEDAGMLATRLSQISFLINLILMIAKALAVKMSNSLSIISSLVDSVVDLISGIIIWWTSHAIRTTNLYVYPVGRSRLEPVAIIILSVIMSLASLEVMIASVRKMIGFGKNMEGIAVFELSTLMIAGSTVVVKFALAVSFYLIMKKKKKQSSAVDALIQDHRNDTMSNLVAILCGYLGSVQFANEVNTRQVAYIDPAGAIVIALYIIISWWQTGSAQLKMITGYTADPGFLSQITWIALNHSPKVQKIDTVRAFHFGSKFLVEVDIVLCGTTVLSESHDIGEKLQQKLEKLPRVERAFVHVDYEFEHRPQDEHQVT